MASWAYRSAMMKPVVMCRDTDADTVEYVRIMVVDRNHLRVWAGVAGVVDRMREVATEDVIAAVVTEIRAALEQDFELAALWSAKLEWPCAGVDPTREESAPIVARGREIEATFLETGLGQLDGFDWGQHKIGMFLTGLVMPDLFEPRLRALLASHGLSEGASMRIDAEEYFDDDYPPEVTAALWPEGHEDDDDE
jgi:hypothetical protein